MTTSTAPKLLKLSWVEGQMVNHIRDASPEDKARVILVLRQELSTAQLLEMSDALRAELYRRGMPYGS